MSFLWFPGCKIAHHQPQYGLDARAVCTALGIELVDMEFNCCGWPLRQESLTTAAVAAARNLAKAEQAGLPLLTPCKCCYGNLKVMAQKLHESERLRDAVRPYLAIEGLTLPENPKVLHLLTVMDRHLDEIKRLTENKGLDNMPVAASYGCHALRPSEATDFDDPLAPTIFERVLEALGARPVPWQRRLECCGHFLREKNDTMADNLGLGKLKDAAVAGAHCVVTGCTYCQMQFEELQAIGLPESLTVAALALRAFGGESE